MLMVLSLHGTLCHVITIVFIVRTVPLKKLMKHMYDYKSIHIHSQSEPCPSGGITDTKPRDLGIFEIKSSEDGYELIKVNNK